MTLDAGRILGSVHFNTRDYERAFDEWTRAHRGLVALAGANTDAALAIQTDLGMARLHAGRAAEAEPILRDALTRVRTTTQDDAPRAQATRYLLADTLLDLQRAPDAAPLLEGLDVASLNVAEQEPDWPALIDFQRGRVALALGRRVEAVALLDRAAAGLAPHDARDHITQARVQALRREAEVRSAAH